MNLLPYFFLSSSILSTRCYQIDVNSLTVIYVVIIHRELSSYFDLNGKAVMVELQFFHNQSKNELNINGILQLKEH